MSYNESVDSFRIFMLLSQLFSKFSKKQDKRSMIRELVFKLKFDVSQEKLYLESLDLLNDSQLDGFYKRLTETIGSIEIRISQANGIQANKQIHQIRTKEKQEKENGYNFLLDNLS